MGSSIMHRMRNGKCYVDVLLDIDVQGGRQIRDKLPEALMIFLLPPSMDELRRRRRSRNHSGSSAR